MYLRKTLLTIQNYLVTKKNICPKNKICTYVENKYNVKENRC